ncbi:MAG: YcgL domain-containing protein [Gammaproteobacteria bacterium]|nr:YcgL domain-containing protein [Gammaproteobacteria bacterium]
MYRSKQKEGYYLFLAQENDFSPVPEAIMRYFGTPEKSMTLYLNRQSKLAVSSSREVLAGLEENGFYIQIPPTLIRGERYH